MNVTMGLPTSHLSLPDRSLLFPFTSRLMMIIKPTWRPGFQAGPGPRPRPQGSDCRCQCALVLRRGSVGLAVTGAHGPSRRRGVTAQQYHGAAVSLRSTRGRPPYHPHHRGIRLRPPPSRRCRRPPPPPAPPPPAAGALPCLAFFDELEAFENIAPRVYITPPPRCALHGSGPGGGPDRARARLGYEPIYNWIRLGPGPELARLSVDRLHPAQTGRAGKEQSRTESRPGSAGSHRR